MSLTAWLLAGVCCSTTWPLRQHSLGCGTGHQALGGEHCPRPQRCIPGPSGVQCDASNLLLLEVLEAAGRCEAEHEVGRRDREDARGLWLSRFMHESPCPDIPGGTVASGWVTGWAQSPPRPLGVLPGIVLTQPGLSLEPYILRTAVCCLPSSVWPWHPLITPHSQRAARDMSVPEALGDLRTVAPRLGL